MSVHLSDHRLLAELIRLGETVLSRPFNAPPIDPFHLDALAHDLTAALRCPGSHPVGSGEVILLLALQTITSGGAATGAELARHAFIAQQALAITRDHYFAAVRAEASRRDAAFGGVA